MRITCAPRSARKAVPQGNAWTCSRVKIMTPSSKSGADIDVLPSDCKVRKRPDRVGRHAHNALMVLDSRRCHRALKERDARVHGRFFVAVWSTRSSCRPVCTVKLSKRENSDHESASGPGGI